MNSFNLTLKHQWSLKNHLNCHLLPISFILGGGDSHFVDALRNKAYPNVYVLDLSANAIERAIGEI